MTAALAVGMDASGNARWHYRYSAGGDESAIYGAVAVGEDVVVCGDAMGRPWLARLDAQGQLVHQVYSTGTLGSFQDLAVGPDGSLTAVGYLGALGGKGILVARLDAGLSWTWQHVYAPSVGSSFDGSVAVDAEGRAFVAATHYQGNGTDIIAFALDPDGNAEWSLEIGEKFNEGFLGAAEIVLSADGHLFLSASRTDYYDDRDDLVATNIRFSWLQSANAGLYLVYNEIDEEGLRKPRREFILKYSRIVDLLN